MKYSCLDGRNGGNLNRWNNVELSCAGHVRSILLDDGLRVGNLG